MRPGVALFDCGGLITSGQERQTFNSVSFSLIQSHLISFPVPRTLTLALSQRERGFERGQGCVVPAFAGTTGLRRMRMYTTMVEGGVSKGQ